MNTKEKCSKSKNPKPIESESKELGVRWDGMGCCVEIHVWNCDDEMVDGVERVKIPEKCGVVMRCDSAVVVVMERLHNKILNTNEPAWQRGKKGGGLKPEPKHRYGGVPSGSHNGIARRRKGSGNREGVGFV
jgi:hypothetical protein